MKIIDIIQEDTTAASIASVAMPITPGTKPDDARKAVDPKGYGPNSKKAKRNKKKVAGYPNVIRRVYDETNKHK